MLHTVTIFVNLAACTCGFNRRTLTGAEASRLGREHAQLNPPAVVNDTRQGETTLYEHLWGWAKSQTITELNEFLSKHGGSTTDVTYVVYDGVAKLHTVADLWEAARFCRDEIRKDEHMKEEKTSNGW